MSLYQKSMEFGWTVWYDRLQWCHASGWESVHKHLLTGRSSITTMYALSG